jgi:cell wall-associated NlpC family hydrolase
LQRHAVKTISAICRPGVNTDAGNLVLFKVVGAKVFNHGGIITQWPRFVHAVDPRVQEADATKHWLTAWKHMAIFDPWVNTENGNR